MAKNTKALNPNSAAGVGFLFALPFFVLNFIVALRFEPFYSFLGSFPFIRNSPFLPLVLLLLFPIGAFVAARPIFKGVKKKVHLINLAVTVVMTVVFVVLFAALGEEFYRCEILQIPNCD